MLPDNPRHPGHARLAADLAAATPDPQTVLKLRILRRAHALNRKLTEAAAVLWLTDLEQYHGGGFHPETAFTEYVNAGRGRRTYSTEEAALLQRVFDRVCGILDVYTVLIPLTEKRWKS